ncbi:unnamed protein product, partial [marine sediment metagenome]
RQITKQELLDELKQLRTDANSYQRGYMRGQRDFAKCLKIMEGKENDESG